MMYETLVSLFQMVLLDVLIIGGGPHALTLASLLSNFEPVPNFDRGNDSPLSASCSTMWRHQPVLEPFSDECYSLKKKKNKRRAVAGKAWVF